MISGFAIAVLVCAGITCQMVVTEPGVSYPTATECAAALANKGKALSGAAIKGRALAGRSQTVCLHTIQTITDVEDRYDALETVIVHSQPDAESGFLGVVEEGQRILVTGLVDGANWVRVALNDGSIGFVYADRLRKSPAPAPDLAAVPPPVTPSAVAPLAVAPPVPSPMPPSAPPPSKSDSAAAAQAAEANPVKPDDNALRDCLTCPVMVRVAGGSYSMGSSLDASERPVHRVTVPGFALGKFMVTLTEWNACVAGGGCTYEPAQAGTPADQRPVFNLSWDDAVQYVQWLRRTTGKPFRLPTEAEWEYAARAGTTTRYVWGDQPGVGHADCEGCGGAHNARSPADVSAYPANAWGLAGMEGGVAEWVEDCWHGSYQGAPADGTAWRGASCAQHVLRGGSWKNPPNDITVSSRNFYDASVRYVANGLRVALSVPGPAAP